MSLKYARLFAIFSIAIAKPVSIGIGEDEGFHGDSIVKVSYSNTCRTRIRLLKNSFFSKAELSFLCIYASIYITLTVLCTLNLLRTPRHCLGVYTALLLSLLFATISTVFSIFVLVIEANGITTPETSTGNILFSLLTISYFFNYWSLPLLFLSICLLVRVRQSSLYPARVSNIFPIVFYVLFALLMVFATVAMSLYVDYMSLFYITGSLNGHTIAWLEHKIDLYGDLGYTFRSLWYLSAVVALSYAAFVYREARRLSLNDKVCISSTLHTCIHPSVAYCFWYRFCGPCSLGLCLHIFCWPWRE